MSSAMDAESKEMLREWLVRSLEPVCDADPEVLSKYVLALIQNDPKKDGLRDTCVAKLDEFLGDETAPFVGRLFTALETDSYRKDSKTNHDDSGRHSGGGGGGAENSGRYSRGEEDDAQRRPLPHHQHQQQQPDGSRRRARGASDEDDDAEHGRYGKQRRRGEEDGGRHGSPRRGGDREREDRRHRNDGHGGRDGGRSGGRGGARDWDRERGGNGGGGGAYPPPGDRRRNFPPEWGMPPPGMWPPHHGYAPPPRGGAGAFPGPPHHLMGEFDPNAYNPENPGMMPHPMSMMMGGRGGYYPPYGGRGGGRGGRSGYNGGRGGPMGMGGPMGKGGDDGSGIGAEAMAKTTLRVSNVDPKYVNMTKLSLHFSKFGNVVNVQMRPQHKCAYVQYATEDEAKKAFHSPMPVCNNRFIEVKWARYDPKDPHGAPSSTDESGEPKGEGASAAAESEGGDADATAAEGGADESATNGQAATPHDANAERNMTPEELRAAALEKGRRVLEEKRELLEKQKQLMKQKEELLKRQLAQQKELLERMSQNPTAVSAADKRELLNKITALSEELKALQPQPQNKLSGLKAELSALEEAAASSAGGGRGRGRGGAAAVGGRWGAPQAGGRGFYGRGAGGGRGGRGAGRAFSNTLDNRTTIVKVENLPEEARDPSVLEQHFGNFGGIERVVMEGADRGFIKFQDRYAGQNALLRGGTFGQTRLQLSWAEAQDAPAELAPATPSGGDAQGDGGAEYATESSEVSASA